MTEATHIIIKTTKSGRCFCIANGETHVVLGGHQHSYFPNKFCKRPFYPTRKAITLTHGIDETWMNPVA
jgi:hypothetical protein